MSVYLVGLNDLNMHKFVGLLGLLAGNVRCPFIKAVRVQLKHAR